MRPALLAVKLMPSSGVARLLMLVWLSWLWFCVLVFGVWVPPRVAWGVVRVVIAALFPVTHGINVSGLSLSRPIRGRAV